MSQPLISIIIPCYNVEKYLDRCINSVVNQTYKNLEIWLVDDESTDSTPQIIDNWAKKDNRIKTIHKKNGGPSDARNAAIDLATGEYINFVDSDDVVAIDHIEYLYSLIQKDGSDISMVWCTPFHEGERVPSISKENKVGVCLTPDEAVSKLHYQDDIDSCPWGKLYKRNLFGNDIRFPKGMIYEDVATLYKVFLRATKISASNYHNYYYLIRENSLEGSKFNINKFDSGIRLIKLLENDRKLLSKASQKALDCRLLSLSFHVFLQIPKKEKQLKHEIFKYIKQYRKNVIFDSKARNKTRVASLLSLGGIKIFDILGRFGLSR